MGRKKSDILYPNCPKCKLRDNVVKNGHSQGKQRWECKCCKSTFISDKTKRQPKFRYSDIKILCAFLYFVGLPVDKIFHVIIRTSKNKMNNPLIVYNWLKKFSEFKNKNKINIKPRIIAGTNGEIKNELMDFSKFFQTCSTPAFLIHLALNGEESEDRKIIIVSNGIKSELKNYSRPPSPFWLKLLISAIKTNGITEDQLFCLLNINKDEISEFTALLNESNSILNYQYKKYFLTIDNNYAEMEKKLKAQSSYVINIFISFDNDYNNLKILIAVKEKNKSVVEKLFKKSL